MTNEYGVKVYKQNFKDGKIKYTKETGKMVLAKIDEKGGRADLLSVKDIKFSTEESQQIAQSLRPKFEGKRGGFGMSKK